MARIKHTKAIEANPRAAKKQLMLISKLKEKRKKQQHPSTSSSKSIITMAKESSSSSDIGGAAAAKKRRWRPGTVVKREIRKLTRSTNLLFPKAPFSRVVREICQNKIANGHDIRFTKNSMKAIQVLTL